MGLVAQTLQTLVSEGVLYAVPRVGTFIGKPHNDGFEFFLLILPRQAGAFDFGQHPDNRGWNSVPGVPQVCFEKMVEDAGRADVVGFDNIGGGRLATGHLIQAGHRRIAFVGLHTPNENGTHGWSALREAGWQKPAGLRLSQRFHPQRQSRCCSQREGVEQERQPAP